MNTKFITGCKIVLAKTEIIFMRKRPKSQFKTNKAYKLKGLNKSKENPYVDFSRYI